MSSILWKELSDVMTRSSPLDLLSKKSRIPFGTERVIHVQLYSEFTVHCTCSLVLKLVPGIVSGTQRDSTCTTRALHVV